MSNDWTPELIVELVRAVIWPASLILLLIAVRFVFRFPFSDFFSKNRLSEFSAAPTGLSAKFIPNEQPDIKKSEIKNYKLTEGADIKSIMAAQDKNLTEYSREDYEGIKRHLEILEATEEEKIELLAKDLSITRAGRTYSDINHLIFRSQFDLISKIIDCSPAPLNDVQVAKHFSEIKKLYNPTFVGWDIIKYISFLVSAGIMVRTGEDYLLKGYFATQLWHSYVEYMKRNPQIIDRLHSI